MCIFRFLCVFLGSCLLIPITGSPVGLFILIVFSHFFAFLVISFRCTKVKGNERTMESEVQDCPVSFLENTNPLPCPAIRVGK